MLEEILSRKNMTLAYKQVITNKGCAGVDGVGVTHLKSLLDTNWIRIKAELLEGSYQPQPVKQVDIPKPFGGERHLGIPTVMDRLIQQAISQELSKHYDRGFSRNSYGFRPGKSCHQALRQAQQYLNEGYRYIVDLDLEKFFDKVNHDYLMHLLSQKIQDKKLLQLIRKYLQSGVMHGGVVRPKREGTPQGGPLSPLLSNILLDKLDKELENRGHKFVRYADDCSIYVKSQRAAERVLQRITKFIEEQLKLKVNQTKSGIRRPSEMQLLGHSFYQDEEGYQPRIASKSYEHFKRKVKQLTKKTQPLSIKERLKGLNALTLGWVNYFKLAKARMKLQILDGWIRRRLRYCIWQQWSRIRTRYRALVRLGASHYNAIRWAKTRNGGWRIANSPILKRTITNARLKTAGYISLTELYSRELSA